MFGQPPLLPHGQTTEQVRQFLRERLAGRLGAAPADVVVDVQRRGTTFLATARAGGVVTRCAVCPRVIGDQTRDAGELGWIHTRVRGRSEQLARALPMVLDVEPQRQWVVFEHLAGQPLLRVLQRGLRGWKGKATAGLLRQTGQLLAQVNRPAATDLGLKQPATCNGDYARQMDLCVVDPRVRRWLPDDGPWQRALGRETGWDFEKRWGNRLLLVDCQPKNVLISPGGEPRFIDIDYATGNPALNLAHFVIALDRLSLRHPLPQQRRRIETWKAAFVQGYLQVGETWIGRDFACFYAWLLMRCLREHDRLHPWLGAYLRRTYGKRLRAYLLSLESGSGPQLPVAASAAA